MNFKALFLFVALWSLLVYYPLAHMVWVENGFIASLGSVDFAGGTAGLFQFPNKTSLAGVSTVRRVCFSDSTGCFL